MQAAVGENESLQGFCEVPEVPSNNHFCLLQYLKSFATIRFSDCSNYFSLRTEGMVREEN